MPFAKGQITAREVLDLGAHLDLETNMIGQFNHFSRECTNPQLSQMCQDLAHSRMNCWQILSKHANINNIH